MKRVFNFSISGYNAPSFVTLKVLFVPRKIRFVFIFFILFLQACQHTEENTPSNNKKADLHKAASYNMQLGLGYLKQGERPRAKEKLLIAHQQDPDSPEVNGAMAYYFEQTKELEQAQKYYLKAISLSAHQGAQLNNYGAFLCRQGAYKNAEIYFLKAVNDMHYVHTSGAYENAGLCALAIPDVDKARLYFTRALNQDPTRKNSLYELIQLESKMGHHTEVFSLLQKYSDLVLNDPVILSLAEDIARKNGKYDLAAQYKHRLNVE